MDLFIAILVLIGFAVIAGVSLKYMLKKDYPIDLGEEARPFVSNSKIKNKKPGYIVQQGNPETVYSPKEFGLTKGTKYQKQRSCRYK
ncbi:hypothetical protein Pedsa_0883 [Pseudopedobacter saltans DSM 12145]|uniref:Uncharacterized protein n=1 Tax=Pseudopedobacter saltans (strain ATCC 51119 / DSM 12145 / JCM 21818 / CCUG 39354 / LMG 10337 / NBRC 100064 / NCIMB 13643) TaxID=762903 RepID=F0SA78_PSESL|nr:hypothetical protein [Pseudopedobacter saltans]ADY51455.1 hypothetical protein Pedsa_0883 [Pseudopedobacter saltans DSM 12145]